MTRSPLQEAAFAAAQTMCIGLALGGWGLAFLLSHSI